MAAETAANAACLSTQPTEVQQALLAYAGGALDAVPMTQVLPAGGQAQVLLNHTVKEDRRIDYRVLVQRGTLDTPAAADLKLLPASAVAAMTIGPNDPRHARLPASGNVTLLSFRMPSFAGPLGDYFWGERTIHVFGCDTDKALSFSTQVSATASDRWVSIGLTLGVVAVIYALLARASQQADMLPAPKPVPPAPGGRLPVPGQPTGPGATMPATGPGQVPRSFRHYLDPVLLTEGGNGRGSLSRLQVFFFSMLVFGLLAYIVMRTGVLSDLSTSILLLLGISGVSAAASAATDVNRNRLAFDNWAWLVRRGWLQDSGLAAERTAKWRDIVTTDGTFDVYRFQMLVFSLVVGGALLTTGLTDLASFEVPQTLLGILGLSQVVYIGGKLTSPPSCADIDAAITDLRRKEDAFIGLAARDPATLTAEEAAAMPAAQAAYRAAMETVWTMFQATLGSELSTKETADRTLHTR
jgi:hypothetical protein